jgi:hypothetical protein
VGFAAFCTLSHHDAKGEQGIAIRSEIDSLPEGLFGSGMGRSLSAHKELPAGPILQSHHHRLVLILRKTDSYARLVRIEDKL